MDFLGRRDLLVNQDRIQEVVLGSLVQQVSLVSMEYQVSLGFLVLKVKLETPEYPEPMVQMDFLGPMAELELKVIEVNQVFPGQMGFLALLDRRVLLESLAQLLLLVRLVQQAFQVQMVFPVNLE